MSTLQKEVNDKTGDICITWTPMSGEGTESARQDFRDAIVNDALNEGSVMIAAEGNTTVFSFRLPKIWRDNLTEAESLIDDHAAAWLPA